MTTRRLQFSSDGFTLLEVMVAALVFSLLLIALPSLLTATTRANRHARSMTAAMSLAQDKLEDLRRQPYTALASGSDPAALTEMEAGGAQRAVYTRKWSVDNGPVTDTKTIVVQVEWPDAGTQRVELRTTLSK